MDGLAPLLRDLDRSMKNPPFLEAVIRNVEVSMHEKRMPAQNRISVMPFRVNRIFSVSEVGPDPIRENLELGSPRMLPMLSHHFLQEDQVQLLPLDCGLDFIQRRPLVEPGESLVDIQGHHLDFHA
jgi:hypothetical protein